MKKLLLGFIVLCSFFAHAEELFLGKTEAELKMYVNRYLPSIQGWCSKEKAEKFIDLILKIKPNICVDLGTYAGSSLFPVACALKFLDQGIVIGIDPWDKLEVLRYFDPVRDVEHIEHWGRINLDHVYYGFLNLIRSHELSNYCITLRSTSEKAGAAINNIDFLYLDGNHSQIVSKKDVELYLPKVRSGGYICINDAMDPQLQHAIDVLMEACEFVDFFDNQRALMLRKR